VFSHIIVFLVEGDFITADERGRHEFSDCLVLSRCTGDPIEAGGGYGLLQMFFQSDWFRVESFENVNCRWP